jgi:RNA recognition motif-containing protein
MDYKIYKEEKVFKEEKVYKDYKVYKEERVYKDYKVDNDEGGSGMDSNHHGDWPLGNKVYVGDLANGEESTRKDLEVAFDKYGSVRNIWIAKRPAGFAFVLMNQKKDAERAVRELDGERIAGQRVKVELSSKEVARKQDRERWGRQDGERFARVKVELGSRERGRQTGS